MTTHPTAGSYADAHSYEVGGESRLCCRRVNFFGDKETVEYDNVCPHCEIEMGEPSGDE